MYCLSPTYGSNFFLTFPRTKLSKMVTLSSSPKAARSYLLGDNPTRILLISISTVLISMIGLAHIGSAINGCINAFHYTICGLSTIRLLSCKRFSVIFRDYADPVHSHQQWETNGTQLIENLEFMYHP